MMVMCWAAETEKTAMRINLINPGPTRTAMRAAAYPGEDPLSLKTPESLAGLFVELASPSCVRHGEWVEF